MQDYYSQLLNYVRQSYAHGYSEDAIRTLLAQGYVAPELIEKVIAEAKVVQKIPVPVSQTPFFVAAARLGTVSAVAAVVFLVRTTGALQGTVSATPTATPPIVAKTTDTSSPSVTPSDTPTPSPSNTPTPSAIPSTAATPTPVASSKAVAKAPAPVKSVAPPPPPAPVYTYKNGTYSAIGSFSTPAGTEKISITISVANDIVTDTGATDMANNRTSSNYNNTFIANYKSLVIGKSLKSLSLGKVSSASLTPNGFNNAVASIRSQAS